MPAYPGFQMPDFDFTEDVQPQQEHVPFDAMSAMLGIQMPTMPTQDPYGRYGITDAQRNRAGTKGLAQAVMGASQSFLGAGPQASIQGGMRAGDVNEAYLDNYSKQNMQSYELQAQEAFRKLDMLSKKSNIELAQLNLQVERDKVKQLQDQKMIANTYAKEMVPVADKLLAKALAINPDGDGMVADLKGDYAQWRAALSAGDMGKADVLMGQMINRFPMENQEEVANEIKVGVANALVKNEVGLQTFMQLQKDYPEVYGDLKPEIGPNGQMTFITPWELEKREMLKKEHESVISNRAIDNEYNRLRLQFQQMLDPKTIDKKVVEVQGAVEFLKLPRPTDQKQLQGHLEKEAKAQATLRSSGLDPSKPEMIEAWNKAPLGERQAFLAKHTYSVYGGLVGAGAAPQVTGGGGLADGGMRVPPPLGHGTVVRLLEPALSPNLSEDEAARILSNLQRANNQVLKAKLPGVIGGSNVEKLRNLREQYFSAMGQNPNQQ